MQIAVNAYIYLLQHLPSGSSSLLAREVVLQHVVCPIPVSFKMNFCHQTRIRSISKHICVRLPVQIVWVSNVKKCLVTGQREGQSV